MTHCESLYEANLKQLTIRGFDEELAEQVQRVANREGISLNQAVLKLLRRGAGLERGQVDRVGSSLDHLIGTWTEEEARELERAVEDFEEIDESMWR